jgi:hypothetical protein
MCKFLNYSINEGIALVHANGGSVFAVRLLNGVANSPSQTGLSIPSPSNKLLGFCNTTKRCRNAAACRELMDQCRAQEDRAEVRCALVDIHILDLDVPAVPLTQFVVVKAALKEPYTLAAALKHLLLRDQGAWVQPGPL